VGSKVSGAEAVTSLLTPEENAELGLADEAGLCVAAGLQYFSLPIPDRDIPYSRSTVIDVIHRVALELERGKNVVIHCRQGVGRSGMIAACVLTATGIEVEEALQRVTASRGLEIPETPAQLLWVRRTAEILHQPATRHS
jgi:protein-tyrosine phosphatase